MVRDDWSAEAQAFSDASSEDRASGAVRTSSKHQAFGAVRRRLLLAGTALASGALVALGHANPAQAACDPNVFGISNCSGVDPAITKVAIGDLVVRFNNQTVTTEGVLIGSAVPANLALVVQSAAVNPIIGTNNPGVRIATPLGHVILTTIAGAPIESINNTGVVTTTTGPSATVISLGDQVRGGLRGVEVTSGIGPVIVTGSGSVTALGGQGIAISSLGGPITVTGTGAVDTSICTNPNVENCSAIQINAAAGGTSRRASTPSMSSSSAAARSSSPRAARCTAIDGVSQPSPSEEATSRLRRPAS